MNLYLKNDKYNQLNDKIINVENESGQVNFSIAQNYNISSGKIFTAYASERSLVLTRIQGEPNCTIEIVVNGVKVDKVTVGSNGCALCFYLLDKGTSVVKMNCSVGVVQSVQSVAFGNCAITENRKMRVARSENDYAIAVEQSGKLSIVKNGSVVGVMYNTHAFDLDISGGIVTVALSNSSGITVYKIGNGTQKQFSISAVANEIAIKTSELGEIVAYTQDGNAYYAHYKDGVLIEQGLIDKDVQSVRFVKNTDEIIVILCSQGKSFSKVWKR